LAFKELFRQGCPLSGILFVIAMELLAQSIKRSKDIKGIRTQGNEEVKLTRYADDTTALLADVQSVSNLFDLLSLFEKCSGLNINQTKSEMLWLGSMRHRKEAICNLQNIAMILFTRSVSILPTLNCPIRKISLKT